MAGLALAGFALGFALRDVLSNLLSGFLILFNRPFAPGARINVTGLEGKVISVDLRYTSLDAAYKLGLISKFQPLHQPRLSCCADETAVSLRMSAFWIKGTSSAQVTDSNKP